MPPVFSGVLQHRGERRGNSASAKPLPAAAVELSTEVPLLLPSVIPIVEFATVVCERCSVVISCTVVYVATSLSRKSTCKQA